MWVQQLNKLGLISMNKLGTLENVADMMTKHVPRGVLDKLAGMMGSVDDAAVTGGMIFGTAARNTAQSICQHGHEDAF